MKLRRSVVRRLMLVAPLILCVNCVSTGSDQPPVRTQNSTCDLIEPVLVEETDVINTRTAATILQNNRVLENLQCPSVMFLRMN